MVAPSDVEVLPDVDEPAANALPAAEPAPLAAMEKEEARAVALAAARAAASRVTPAQREHAIAQAAAAAYAAQRDTSAAAAAGRGSAEQEAAQPLGSASGGGGGGGGGGGVPAAAAAREASTYSEPEWSGAPQGVEYALEVMKGGQILERRDVHAKASYSFGRSPACDFPMEHPTISRMHAVLQFRGADGAAFVYDAGSVHGTFLNKRRIKARVHAPLSVGDLLKFGGSSRMYLFCGPAELMPEEGLTRKQKQQLAAMEAKEARREREAQVAKAQMDSALARGVSWGFGEDAVVEPEDVDAASKVDWRAYSDTHGLTDKQQKLATKVRKRELRISNLQTEMERIKAKQGKMDELSAGQASTLARNEAAIDKATEELEELEEALCESIAESIRGRRAAAEKQPGAKKKKRRRVDPEEEAAERASSGDDEFYDRTADGRAKKLRAKDAPALDAASLYGRKEALLGERAKLSEALRREEASAAALAASSGPPGLVTGLAPGPEAPAAAASAEADPAAAGIDPVTDPGGPGGAERPAAVADRAGGAAAAGAAGGERVAEHGSGAAGGASAQAPDADALDAYMSAVRTQIELDKVSVLRREIDALDVQVAEAERMLKLADPENYFRAGTRAAEAAKQKGILALQAERQRRTAEALARQAAKERSSALVAPETEGAEEVPLPSAAPGAPRMRPANSPAAASAAQAGTAAPPGAAPAAAAPAPTAPVAATAPPAEALHRLEATAAPRDAAEAAETPGFGLEVRKRPDAPLGAKNKGKARVSGLLSREEVTARAAAAKAAAGVTSGGAADPKLGGAASAEAQLAADLALLQGSGREGADLERGEPRDEGGPWQPPKGQKGDGRTSLNDVLGY
ncbi:hypothetical protein WJX81_005069 [Elliptochloris bilobata]|uniref:FHA domain-containing protein n=1 Tax=Elliptochloris bilobata TaxID=381761 RepID=A0AAW1RIY2_9CHLO